MRAGGRHQERPDVVLIGPEYEYLHEQHVASRSPYQHGEHCLHDMLCAGRYPQAMYITGYPPWHRENRENGPKNPCQGKGREFGNFAKAQGILFAQDVNSLILKVKDIAIFAAKTSHFL